MNYVWEKLYSAMEVLPLWAKILIYLAFFALGVFCLVKFCDMFVDSASVIAHKLKMPAMVIGLTIVAMGTSLPELSVSLSDAISKVGTGETTAIAIGNVVGSNICNVLLVLALSVLFTPIVVKRNTRRHELPILLGVTAVLVVMICLFNANADGSFAFVGTPRIGRVEGAILFALFVGYIAFTLVMAKKHPEDAEEVVIQKDMGWAKAIVLCIVGCLGIIIGGQFVSFGAEHLAVDSAVAAGLDEELTKSLVAVTVVAIGTSLPELVTSVIAAKKGQNDIALGNVIGSNIFNALFILGISALVNPLVERNTAIVDALVMLAVAVMLVLMSLRGKLNKKHGIVMLCVYALYTTYLVLRTIYGWDF